MGASDQFSLPEPEGLPDPQVWRQTSRSLHRLARSIVGEDALAEDLVQGAWLRSLESGGGSKGPGWMRLWVKSRAIDLVRRRRSQPMDRLEGESHPGAEAQTGDEIALRFELQRAVLAAVEGLPEPYRTTVFLRYFDELGPAEIGQRMGVPLKTVKSRLTRAHGRLRGVLRAGPGDGASDWSPAFLAFAGWPAGPPAGAAAAAGGTSLSLCTPILMKKIAVGFALILVAAVAWRWSGPQTSVSGLAGTPSETTGPDLVALAQPADRAAPPPQRLDVTRAGEREGSTAQPAEDALAGAVRVRMDRADGLPAVGVQAILAQSWSYGSSERAYRQEVDAQGVAYFSTVPPGPFVVQTSHSAGMQLGAVEVTAGLTAEVGVVLPAGLEVRGRVVDRGGAPVAGASVWLTSGSRSWTSGSAVAVAGANGAFVLRNVARGLSLGALKEGYGPSPLVDLDALPDANALEAGGSAEITLVLSPGGAIVRGIVKTSSGEALAGALVAAGEPGNGQEVRMDGSSAERWGPRAARTGEDGRFELVGLAPGKSTLRVRQFGWARWSSRLNLVAGQASDHLVVLDRGATVRGVVTTESGRPAPGATIHAFDRPLSETYLQNGQVDTPSILAHEVAEADERGAFQLERVSARMMHLYALAPKPDGHLRGVPLLFARTQLDLIPGEEREWNPVLSAGRVIEGMAHYGDGTAIENVFVSITSTDPGRPDRRALRSTDGSFRFIQLLGEAYDVRVQMRERPAGAADPRVLGVVPGGAFVEAVADWPAPESQGTSRISVRFQDQHSRHSGRGQLSLWLEHVEGASFFAGSAIGEVWRFSVERAGSYRPVAFAGDRLIAVGSAVEVELGVDIDLGTLATRPGGTLVLHFEGPPDGDAASVRGYLEHAGCRSGETIQLGGEETLRIDNLEPGRGAFRLVGGPVLRTVTPFRIVAGEEAHASVALTSAVAVPYAIAWDPMDPPESLSVRFRDQAGNPVLGGHEVPIGSLRSSPLRSTQFLAPGSYVLEVSGLGGDSRSRSLKSPRQGLMRASISWWSGRRTRPRLGIRGPGHRAGAGGQGETGGPGIRAAGWGPGSHRHDNQARSAQGPWGWVSHRCAVRGSFGSRERTR